MKSRPTVTGASQTSIVAEVTILWWDQNGHSPIFVPIESLYATS